MGHCQIGVELERPPKGRLRTIETLRGPCLEVLPHHVMDPPETRPRRSVAGIDSLQLTATHKVATPVNWTPGEDVIIVGSVSDDDAKKTYPQGWRAPRPYIRIVPQPGVLTHAVR